jgi:hypothetical protein
MRKCLLLLVLLAAVSTNLVSCSGKEKTPEEVLTEMKLDETAFDKLSACEQVETFAEVGYQFMDLDHMYVNVPSWVYDSIKSHEAQVNASCIKDQILKYLANIDQSPAQKKEASLKIHALIYLSNSLDLLANPGIVDTLEFLVCQKKIWNYESFIVIYTLTKSKELPSFFAGKPEDLDRLWIEECKK